MDGIYLIFKKIMGHIKRVHMIFKQITLAYLRRINIRDFEI